MSDREPVEAETLNPSEALDEDQLQLDPLEDGVEPPEHWSAANRFGTTPAEAREGEPLDQRLAEEVPDVQPEPIPDRPTAITPVGGLDESIDAEPADVEQVAPDELSKPRHAASDHGERADRAGGSVADAIREARRSV
ncbi:hypothetical protein [Amycolatopsis sp. H20-H5]|uniref:hypothetical protein n=1 Tax=Amycolatopsis sp. H20-H5 TaxID=3046309 RepID=UPI002DB89AF3|nr:hypothetical protein [Amycolatopsis sp. H20-H5]MEC3973664.1 hypothetical protein [Amycolatopsis sp. H20-H5]